LTLVDDEKFILHPGEFALGSTFERVELPDNISAKIEGKSSLGRIGLIVHSTAGFVDPGFRGPLTLEFANLLRIPIALIPEMKIAQLSFTFLDRPAKYPYGSEPLGSHYQDQGPAVGSRWEQ